jgi:hypothetical protein
MLFLLASPSYTLEQKRGHCNPKGALFHAMLSAVNVQSRMRVIHIHLNPLITTQFADVGVHMFMDVQVDPAKNEWVTVDGYVGTLTILAACTQRLLLIPMSCQWIDLLLLLVSLH